MLSLKILDYFKSIKAVEIDTFTDFCYHIKLRRKEPEDHKSRIQQ